VPGDIAASDGATPTAALPSTPLLAMGAQPVVPTTPIAASLVQGFDPGGGIAGSLVPAAQGQTFVVGTGAANGTLWGIARQIDPANQAAQVASLAQSNGLRVDQVTGAVNIHPGQVLSVPDLSAADPATLADLARSGGAITAASQQARDADGARIAQQAATQRPGALVGTDPRPAHRRAWDSRAQPAATAARLSGHPACLGERAVRSNRYGALVRSAHGDADQAGVERARV
jgi:hypothetical protein